MQIGLHKVKIGPQRPVRRHKTQVGWWPDPGCQWELGMERNGWICEIYRGYRGRVSQHGEGLDSGPEEPGPTPRP